MEWDVEVEVHFVGVEDYFFGRDGCSGEEGHCRGEVAGVEFTAGEEAVAVG